MIRKFYFLLALVAAGFVSCDKEKDTPEPEPTPAEAQISTISTELAKHNEVSAFAEELKNLDVANIQAEEFTVFAVKNESMSKSYLKATSETVDMKRHVVSGSYPKSKLTRDTTLRALSGDNLAVTVMNGKIWVNGVQLGNEVKAGKSVAFIVDEPIPAQAPVVGRDIVFNIIACNKAWSESFPQEGGPSVGATVKIYADDGVTLVNQYTTDVQGKATIKLTAGNTYKYLVQRDSANNISKEGYLIAGIFTSQDDIDSWTEQPQAARGNLKFVDLNGDGLINNQDKVSKASLYVADTTSVVTAYIAYPSHDKSAKTRIEEMQYLHFYKLVSASYLVDACLTQGNNTDANLVNYTFDASNLNIYNVWRYAYKVIDEMYSLVAITNGEQQAEVRLMRSYAYYVALNYFGNIPVISERAQVGSDEIADIILSDMDQVGQSGTMSQKARALMLKARVYATKRNWANVLSCVDEVKNTGRYQLYEASVNYSLWTTPALLSGESIWDNVAVGTVKKHNSQTYVYPLRYTETLLLYAEASLENGQTMGAVETINMLNGLAGDPFVSPSTPVDEIRSTIRSLWTDNMDREGMTYILLKRWDTFLYYFSSFGAQEKHLLLPIPSEAINQNPKLRQNLGY